MTLSEVNKQIKIEGVTKEIYDIIKEVLLNEKYTVINKLLLKMCSYEHY